MNNNATPTSTNEFGLYDEYDIVDENCYQPLLPWLKRFLSDKIFGCDDRIVDYSKGGTGLKHGGEHLEDDNVGRHQCLASLSVDKDSLRRKMEPLLPFLYWLPDYDMEWIKRDVMAGLTVAILLVPQSLAYANLCGLPAVWGIYSSIVPMIIFAMFTTSGQIAWGPGAATSIMTASAIEALVGPEIVDADGNSDPDYTIRYQQFAIAVTFMCGLVQTSLGVFRLGTSITKLLTKPVMTGFITSAACYIVAGQLKHLLGLQMGRYSIFFETIYHALRQLTTINGWTILVTGVSIFVFGLPKVRPQWFPRFFRVCIPLVWVAVCAAVSYFADFEGELSIDIVGSGVKSGFPMPEFPSATLIRDNFFGLLSSSFVAAVVSFIAGLALGQTLQQKIKETHRQDMDCYEVALLQQQRDADIGVDSSVVVQRPLRLPNLNIHPNREAIAFGISNVLGCAFSSQVGCASFSRTALNADMDSVTPISVVVQAIFALMALLFFMPFLSFLPKCVLAALVFVSTRRLFQNGIRECRLVMDVSRAELLEYCVSVFVPLGVGLETGIACAVFVSIAVTYYRQSINADVVELGFIESKAVDAGVQYVSVHNFREAQRVAGVCILELRAQLSFSNCERLVECIKGLDAGIDHIVLSMAHTQVSDTTALRGLFAAFKVLKGKTIAMSHCRQPIRTMIGRFTEHNNKTDGVVVADKDCLEVQDSDGAVEEEATAPAGYDLANEEKVRRQSRHAVRRGNSASSKQKTSVKAFVSTHDAVVYCQLLLQRQRLDLAPTLSPKNRGQSDEDTEGDIIVEKGNISNEGSIR